MTELLFYHLQRQPIERVLPPLLEKALQRDWRVVVQLGAPERVDALDDLLWTYSDDSFLPHGSQRDGDAELQAVWLTTGDDNPNGANVRFLVDGVQRARHTSNVPIQATGNMAGNLSLIKKAGLTSREMICANLLMRGEF